MAWIEYPIQTRTGNYVNGRYDPATGAIQVKQDYSATGQDNWTDIGSASQTAQGTQNAQYSDPYGNIMYPGMLPTVQQLWQMGLAGQQQAQGAGGGGASYQPQQTYFGQMPQFGFDPSTGYGWNPERGAPVINAGGVRGGSSMTWDDVRTQLGGLSQRDQDAFIARGNTPEQVLQSFRTTGKPPAAGPPPQPETTALGQMAQIDPTSEALRQALGQSYLQNLQGGAQPPAFDMSQGTPTAANLQSYLDLYKQIDPTGYAQRAALAGQMGSYLQGVQQQAALGSQLDPGTLREVEQGTRAAQAARGNIYGTPQLVAETMARGTAGEQRLQQRQAALQSALGAQQSYLTSGAGMGDVANQLFNQGWNRYLQGYGQQVGTWQAQQNALLGRQQAALGYLGSSVTPYQAGASYMDRAQNAAAMAAQGGPQYNPSALGPQYSGTAQQFPQYGLDMSQLAGNWYNNINQANLQGYQLGQAYGQRGGSGMGAATGALGGAASGALAGSAAGPWGTAIGAGVGALAGGLSGYSR